MSRIYVVRDSQDSTNQSKFLVDADSQTQAIGMVVADRYEAKAATTSEVAELMEAGVRVMKVKKPVQGELALSIPLNVVTLAPQTITTITTEQVAEVA